MINLTAPTAAPASTSRPRRRKRSVEVAWGRGEKKKCRGGECGRERTESPVTRRSGKQVGLGQSAAGNSGLTNLGTERKSRIRDLEGGHGAHAHKHTHPLHMGGLGMGGVAAFLPFFFALFSGARPLVSWSSRRWASPVFFPFFLLYPGHHAGRWAATLRLSSSSTLDASTKRRGEQAHR